MCIPRVRDFVFWRKGHSACTCKYLYQESYFAEMFVVASSMPDKAWLHCALPMPLVILAIYLLPLLCILASPSCRVSTRINVNLYLGDPNRGVSFIFRCLFHWHIFLIWWNVRQGVPSNCIVLWSNKSIVWVTLLPGNKGQFCVNFSELFLQVSSWISYSIKTENGAVSHRQTYIRVFHSVMCVSPTLRPPTFSLSFLSFSYNSSLIILH